MLPTTHHHHSPPLELKRNHTLNILSDLFLSYYAGLDNVVVIMIIQCSYTIQRVNIQFDVYILIQYRYA